jgi:hypothetical protein
MIKNHKLKKNWCKEDCTILAWILEKITIGRHVKTPEKIVSMFLYRDLIAGKLLQR